MLLKALFQGDLLKQQWVSRRGAWKALMPSTFGCSEFPLSLEASPGGQCYRPHPQGQDPPPPGPEVLQQRTGPPRVTVDLPFVHLSAVGFLPPLPGFLTLRQGGWVTGSVDNLSSCPFHQQNLFQNPPPPGEFADVSLDKTGIRNHS